MPYLLALMMTVALSACGVSTSDTVDEGDGVSGGVAPADFDKKPPPSPDASLPDRLVRDFLEAAVGGVPGAIDQVKAFLTPKAQELWQEPANPSLTVIRMIRPPVTGAPV